MIRRRDVLRLAAQTTLASVFLAACGQPAATPTTAPAATAPPAVAATTAPAAAATKPAATAAPAAAPTTAPAAKPAASGPAVEISMASYGDPVALGVYEVIKKSFDEQNAGKYSAKLIITPGAQYIDKTLSMLAGGNPPDVFLTYAQHKKAWVTKDLLLDVTDRYKGSTKVSLDMYYKPVVDAISLSGKVWGSPWGYNSEVMFLNLDLFEQAGVSLPKEDWTAQDYREMAAKLVKSSEKIFGTDNAANNAGQQMFSLMWNWGKHYWIDAEENKSLVNSSQAVEMFQFHQDMALKDKSMPSPDNQLLPNVGARQGAIAMWISYSTEPIWILDAAKGLDKIGKKPFRWKMHTFYKGPQDQQHFSQGHLWSIAKTHKKPDDAWVLTEWLGSMAAEQVWAQEHRTPPQVPDEKLWKTYYSQLPDADAQTAIDFILKKVYGGLAINFQYWGTFAECSAVMQTALDKIYGDAKAPVKPQMDDAAKQMEEILKRAKS